MALFSSSTREVPTAAAVPRHVAVIMDGNGRWAKKRLMPRFSGHVKGVAIVRKMVRACLERGIEYLTLFAFSSENWRRPEEEVSLLMQLFVKALEQEVDKLDQNGVRLRIIGDLSHFEPQLQDLIRAIQDKGGILTPVRSPPENSWRFNGLKPPILPERRGRFIPKFGKHLPVCE